MTGALARVGAESIVMTWCRLSEMYDRLGPERFFSEHGFGPSRSYDLVWDHAHFTRTGQGLTGQVTLICSHGREGNERDWVSAAEQMAVRPSSACGRLHDSLIWARRAADRGGVPD